MIFGVYHTMSIVSLFASPKFNKNFGGLISPASGGRRETEVMRF